MSEANLTTDQLVAGRYRVQRLLGRGGMGTVYAAFDERLDAPVALKQLCLAGDDFSAAFAREARVLARLRHLGLPRVIDYFVEPPDHYLVMELIEGVDLAQLLTQREGPIALKELLYWLDQLVAVLDYLHRLDPPVVHRDIKPANLKLTPRGELVLLDFGLAKGLFSSESGSLLGYTPGYAPPEQIAFEGTDPRSDIYALAATLYHLLTGTPPPGASARMLAHLRGQPDPLLPAHELLPELPTALSAVLARALDPLPEQRYATALIFQAAIHEALRADPLAALWVRQARRLDMAAAAQAQLGAPIDCLVQVRFASSPLLGREEWPQREPPAQIAQAASALALDFAADPQSGALAPCRLLARLHAPSFALVGQGEQLLEVPPERYSACLSFQLIGQAAGRQPLTIELWDVEGRSRLGMATLELEVRAAQAELGLAVASIELLVRPALRSDADAATLGGYAAAALAHAAQEQNIELPAQLGPHRLHAAQLPAAPTAPARRGEQDHAISFAAAEYRVVLAIVPPAAVGGAAQLEGQLSGAALLLAAAPGHARLLRDGHELQVELIDELGFFAFDTLAPGEYTIELRFGPQPIVIDGITMRIG